MKWRLKTNIGVAELRRSNLLEKFSTQPPPVHNIEKLEITYLSQLIRVQKFVVEIDVVGLQSKNLW